MNWKNQTLLIGAVAGLVIGLVGAYIVVQRSEQLNVVPSVSPADGIKLGLSLLTTMRMVADIADKG